jgi:ADP-heptose:LPS heptosyltransferase
MKSKQKRHRKIAILQLSRLGDIMMSLPVIEALYRKCGNAEISLIINGMFEDVMPESPCFKIVPIHFNELFADLKHAETVEGSVQILDRYLVENLPKDLDFVVNLSSHKISAILASLLMARDQRGLNFLEDETVINSDPYLSLFTQIKTGRKINWLHQLEIYASVIHGFKPGPLHQTGKYLFGDNLLKFLGERLVGESYVLISPGASIPQKEIGKEVLESIIKGILNLTDYRIILCGTKNDALAHKKFQRLDIERITDYAGKTDVPELYNLIYFSDCLISNDSGPMHIAALLDKKNVVFSSGSAFFPETTGYNNNVMVITPQGGCYPCPWIGSPCGRDFACKTRDVGNGVVRRVLDYIEGKDVFSSRGQAPVYMTKINSRGILFIPCEPVALTFVQLLGLLYQSFWKEKLFGVSSRETLDHNLKHYRILHRDLDKALPEMESTLQQFHSFVDQLLLSFGDFKRCGTPKMLERINRGIDKIFDLSDQDTFLSPLLQYRKVLYHSTIRDNLNELLKEYHRNTVALREDLQRMGDLISFFLSEHLGGVDHSRAAAREGESSEWNELGNDLPSPRDAGGQCNREKSDFTI